jgi:PAS domain S-box-containing protein
MSVRAPKKSAGKPHGLSLQSLSSGALDEATYRDIVEQFPQVMWIADPKGTITYGNRLWYELTGLSPEQTAQNGWISLIHPEDRPRALANWRKLIATGVSSQGEYRFRRASDGEYRWHFIQTLSMKDAEGAVLRRVGIAVDIHTQKASEIALREKDDQLKLAMEAGRLGTWDFILAGHRFISSYRSRALFGRPPDVELTFHEFIGMLHPEDRNVLQQAYIRALEPTGLSEFEINYRIIRPDGAVRWIAARGKGIFAGSGSERKPVRLTGTVQDITEKKLAEEALRASEAHLRAIVETEPECVKLLSANGHVLDMNASGLAMIEADSLEQIQGHSLINLVDPKYRSQFAEVTKQVFQGNPGSLEFEITGLKGTRRWLQTHATALLDKNGQPNALLGITRDITHQKAAEKALRDSEQKFRTAFHANPEAMSITTLADGVYLDVNDAFSRVTGFAREDVVGRKSSDVGSWVEKEDRERLVEGLKAKGRVESMEISFRKKNGDIFFVHLSAELIEIGKLRCVLATSQDVTERRRVTRELRRSEEQHRTLIECAPYGICQITAQGRFLLVNPALVKMLGYESASDLLALDVSTQVYADPEARASLLAGLTPDSAQQPPREAQWKRRDGQTITVRLAGRPIYDDQERLLHSEVYVELVTREAPRQA